MGVGIKLRKIFDSGLLTPKCYMLAYERHSKIFYDPRTFLKTYVIMSKESFHKQNQINAERKKNLAKMRTSTLAVLFFSKSGIWKPFY